MATTLALSGDNRSSIQQPRPLRQRVGNTFPPWHFRETKFDNCCGVYNFRRAQGWHFGETTPWHFRETGAVADDPTPTAGTTTMALSGDGATATVLRR